jgi:hypothetical protein
MKPQSYKRVSTKAIKTHIENMEEMVVNHANPVPELPNSRKQVIANLREARSEYARRKK